MLDIVFNYIGWLGLITITLPLVVGVARFKKFNHVTSLAFWLVVLAAIFEVIAAILAELGIQNIFLFPVWVSIEVILVSLFYYRILTGFWRNIALLFGAAIMSIAIWDLMNKPGISSMLRICEGVAFAVLPMVYFYQMMTKLEVKSLVDDAVFWINTALFIYFCGSFFFFAASGGYDYSNLSDDDMLTLKVIFAVNLLNLAIRNFLLAVGFVVISSSSNKKDLGWFAFDASADSD